MLSWLAHPSCEGIAISAPGYIDPHSGFITMGGAIRRFDNFAMKSWLETRTGLPVSVENDANCAAGRALAGQSGGDANFLVLTIGTGIGGAIFCQHQLINGRVFVPANSATCLPTVPADAILVAIR